MKHLDFARAFALLTWPFVLVALSPVALAKTPSGTAPTMLELADKAEAKYQLGKKYVLGVGVARDYALAGKAFAEAVHIGAGHNAAAYELGKLKFYGDGFVQDYADSAKYFKIAAFYNDATEQPAIPDAQYLLSTMYAGGKGVVQDEIEAARYLRMAARNDHTMAQLTYGAMFMAGRGVAHSNGIGYLWIARAAEGPTSERNFSETTKSVLALTNGKSQAIKARDQIRTQMTAAQIAEATALVERCVANTSACSWGN